VPPSRDPQRRARQLANLRRGGTPAPKGNRFHVVHGAYAAVARDRLDAKVRDVFDALATDAPLRGRDGELPAADGAAVRLAAEVLCRLDSLGEYLALHGIIDGDGELRGAVDIESRLRREAADHLDSLGMTPRSRARLGLDVTRAAAFDLAGHWAEEPETIDATEADHA